MKEDEILKRGRGRPKKEVTYDEIVALRLNPEEKEMLDYLIDQSGENKSDIVRRALRGYYVYLREVGMIGERE